PVPDLMAYPKRQIPQWVKYRFDRFFIDLRVEEKQQINVGFRMNCFATISSDRKQRKSVRVQTGILPQAADDIVHAVADRPFNRYDARCFEESGFQIVEECSDFRSAHSQKRRSCGPPSLHGTTRKEPDHFDPFSEGCVLITSFDAVNLSLINMQFCGVC